MAMFTCYFEDSVNVKVENQRGKFIILISRMHPIYSILIRSENLLFVHELSMSFFKEYLYMHGG